MANGIEAKFIDRVTKSSSGCWLWIGDRARTQRGDYGVLSSAGTRQYAHRWSYGHFVRQIPKGQQIDHKCRNTLCVNPEHLDCVTNRENTVRGKRSALNPRKSSRYVGVYWEIHQGKARWKASIKMNGKLYTLGRFLDEEEARDMYRQTLETFEKFGALPPRRRYIRKRG